MVTTMATMSSCHVTVMWHDIRPVVVVQRSTALVTCMLTVMCDHHCRLVSCLVAPHLSHWPVITCLLFPALIHACSHPLSSLSITFMLVGAGWCSLLLAFVSSRSCLLSIIRTCFGACDGSACLLHPPIAFICTRSCLLTL